MSDHDPDKLFEEGIRLFNERNFFEAHEVLEELWNMQSGDDKQFTQGILQIAVGLYHLLRSNRVGAEKLLNKGLSRVVPFVPAYRGVNVAKLVEQTDNVILNLMSPGQSDFSLPSLDPMTD